MNAKQFKGAKQYRISNTEPRKCLKYKPSGVRLFYYTTSDTDCKPHFEPGGRCLPMSGWELFFTVLGVSRIVSLLFRLVDVIERG